MLANQHKAETLTMIKVNNGNKNIEKWRTAKTEQNKTKY